MARVVFVTSRLPYPPREGHQLRSWHLLRAVSREHEVDLLSLQREQDPAEPPAALRDTVRSVHCVKLPPLRDPFAAFSAVGKTVRDGDPLMLARYVPRALQKKFRGLIATADLVHLDILAVAGLLPDVPSKLPVVLNEHNVESELLRARATMDTSRWRRGLLRWQADEFERFERDACSQASRVLACSEIDAARLRELAPGSRVEVVPNGVDLAEFTPGEESREQENTLVFVGQMSWFPNRDGIEDFMANTLPVIREHCDVRLRVIGRSDGMQAPENLRDYVEFTGFVDDLRPLVQQAAVYVVPLRAGSGTRLKLLEAMAMGKAIVSTRIGAEGIGLRHGENALLADTPTDFAAAVCRLLADAPLRQRLGQAARRAAEREFGWDAIGDRLLRVYSEVLGSTSDARQR
jgi:glycosyltransferase involved in cell wall biosynthesis